MQFASPQLADTELTRAYTEYYYPKPGSGQSVRYESTPETLLHQFFLRLQQRIGPLEGLKMLDYGCGHGVLSRIGQQFGLITTGIEQDPIARGIAAAIPKMRAYANLKELRMAEPRKQFDLVLLWNVIEHLRYPWCDLQELHDVLCPSGYLGALTPNVGCLRARLERGKWVNYENPTHFYYFDSKSLRRVLNKAGYTGMSEWKLKFRYPHHGVLQRWFYEVLFLAGLSDGLFYFVKNGNKP
ncbi:MAG: class I SAM-dependent methyltransferase [Candidatus Acidiferrum sp.]